MSLFNFCPEQTQTSVVWCSEQKVSHCRGENEGPKSNLWIICQRDVCLSKEKRSFGWFFRHESQACPPNISERGLIRVSKSKVRLVPCLIRSSDCNILNFRTTPLSLCVVVHGASVAQAVSPKRRLTCQHYAVNIFWRQILRVVEVHSITRLDVVFGRYLPQSIKRTARSTRGHSSARLVENEKSVPRNWNGFYTIPQTKENVFKLLALTVPPS